MSMLCASKGHTIQTFSLVSLVEMLRELALEGVMWRGRLSLISYLARGAFALLPRFDKTVATLRCVSG